MIGRRICWPYLVIHHGYDPERPHNTDSDVCWCQPTIRRIVLRVGFRRRT